MAEKKLKLHSIVGAEPAVYFWPIPKNDDKDGAVEIVETIKFMCEEVAELQAQGARLVDSIPLYNTKRFEDMRELCDVYNEAVDNIRRQWRGTNKETEFRKQKTHSRWLKHIISQCYNKAVEDPEKLNEYEPFSPEVYGETSFDLVDQMIRSTKLGEKDRFIDLGSGVGQVVLQVAAATNCEFCYGIEKAETPSKYAVTMEAEFRKWMAWYGRPYSNFKIEKGDFLEKHMEDKIKKASLVFVNNFAFGPKVDHELKIRFMDMEEGARIVSSKAFCPLNFRITDRNLSDIGSMLSVCELTPLADAVSWTDKALAYYVHTIDRKLLEKYFLKLKNPELRDEEDTVRVRKDRRGRPLSSWADEFQSPRSEDESSRSLAQHDGEARPISGRALSLTDNASDTEDEVILGPTTRRAWKDQIGVPPERAGGKKRGRAQPRRLQNMEDAPEDSGSTTDDYGDEMDEKEKGDSRSSSVTEDSKQLIGVAKRRNPNTRRKRLPGSNNRKSRAPPASMVDTLDFLHSQTLFTTSTEGYNSTDQFNDKNMSLHKSVFKTTEALQSSSAIKAHQPVMVAVEKHCEAYKQQLVQFIQHMQTSTFKEQLEKDIRAEKERAKQLKNRAAQIEKQIATLQKDSLGHLKTRLGEMGIVATTPAEFLAKAKEIVIRHKELQIQATDIQGTCDQLEEQQSKMLTESKVNVANVTKLMEIPTTNISKDQILQEVKSVYQNKRRLQDEAQRLENEVAALQDTKPPTSPKPSRSPARKQSRSRRPSSQSKENSDSFDARLKSIITSALIGESESNRGKGAALTSVSPRDPYAFTDTTPTTKITASTTSHLPLSDDAVKAVDSISCSAKGFPQRPTVTSSATAPVAPPPAAIPPGPSSGGRQKSTLKPPVAPNEMYSPVSRPSSSSSTCSADSVRGLRHGDREPRDAAQVSAHLAAAAGAHGAGPPQPNVTSAYYEQLQKSIQMNPAAMYAAYPMGGMLPGMNPFMMPGGFSLADPSVTANPLLYGIHAAHMNSLKTGGGAGGGGNGVGAQAFPPPAGSVTGASHGVTSANKHQGGAKAVHTAPVPTTTVAMDTDGDKAKKQRRKRAGSKATVEDPVAKRSTPDQVITTAPKEHADVAGMMSVAQQPLAITAISDAESSAKSSPVDPRRVTGGATQERWEKDVDNTFNSLMSLATQNMEGRDPPNNGVNGGASGGNGTAGSSQEGPAPAERRTGSPEEEDYSRHFKKKYMAQNMRAADTPADEQKVSPEKKSSNFMPKGKNWKKLEQSREEPESGGRGSRPSSTSSVSSHRGTPTPGGGRSKRSPSRPASASGSTPPCKTPPSKTPPLQFGGLASFGGSANMPSFSDLTSGGAATFGQSESKKPVKPGKDKWKRAQAAEATNNK